MGYIIGKHSALTSDELTIFLPTISHLHTFVSRPISFSPPQLQSRDASLYFYNLLSKENVTTIKCLSLNSMQPPDKYATRFTYFRYTVPHFSSQRYGLNTVFPPENTFRTIICCYRTNYLNNSHHTFLMIADRNSLIK